MRLSANLKDGYTNRVISMEIPVIQNPLLPVPYVDSRWARPFVFRNVALYPLSEVKDVINDFNKLVYFVSSSYSISTPLS